MAPRTKATAFPTQALGGLASGGPVDPGAGRIPRAPARWWPYPSRSSRRAKVAFGLALRGPARHPRIPDTLVESRAPRVLARDFVPDGRIHREQSTEFAGALAYDHHPDAATCRVERPTRTARSIVPPDSFLAQVAAFQRRRTPPDSNASGAGAPTRRGVGPFVVGQLIRPRPGALRSPGAR